MKAIKLSLTLLTIITLTSSIKAQSTSFQKGQVDLNIGITNFGSGIMVGSERVSSTTPFTTIAEYGITENISVGANFGYASSKTKTIGTEIYTDQLGYTQSRQFTDLFSTDMYNYGLRASFHFNEFINNDKLDLYAGANAGVLIGKYSRSTNRITPDNLPNFYNSLTGIDLGVFIGGRYRFTKHLGAFAEAGYKSSNFTVGVNIRF